MSLRNKLLFMVLGLVVLIGAVNLLYVRSTTIDLLRNDLTRTGLILARNLAEEAVQPMLKDKTITLHLMIHDTMALDPDVGYVFFVDYKGNVLSHSFDEGFPRDLATINPVADDKAYAIQALATDRGNYMDLAIPIQQGQAGEVHVGMSERSVEEKADRIVLVTTVIILLLIGAGGFLALIFTNLVTRPMRKLTLAAEAVGRGEMDVRVRVRSRDEVGRLAGMFNEMTGRLAGLLAREREFAARTEAEKRAAEASEALERAEQSNLAMLNVMEDLEAARKDAEEKNLRLRKLHNNLVRSNEELQQFAYVASHDLQEPLRMVSSYNQLLARRYKGKLDETADEYIRHSVEGVQRMQDLITDLLAYSRVGTKGGTFAEVDMGRAFDTARDNLSIRIQESDAEVTRDEMPRLMADEVQITQLFQNLLMNALKYHDEEKPVIRATVSEYETEWVFSVRDNGIGITVRDQERIFVIFQRLHARDEYGGGTGIGLAVCKRILERHGGRIWVESDPGKGSIFFFALPKSRARTSKDDRI